MNANQIADNQADLLTFVKTMFRARKGADLMAAPHHKPICDALERVVIGETRRLIINIPPRSGKTELAVINFIAWCMGNFPDSEFIHASYSKRLATSNAYAVRATMLHETYRAIFPHTALAGDSQAKDEFRTRQGGLVYATGAEGSITGVGAGKMRSMFGGAIVIDDPHKAGEGASDTMRNNVLDWFSTTMESRKNRPDTPIIVIMQRLHERDLAGWLMDNGNGESWDVLKIPARDEDGVSFWPEQFPDEMLERLESTNPYVYAGQYMQEPAPLGGGDFQTDNIQMIDALPAGLSFVRGWDFAASTKKTSDYTASVKLAVKDGITYIADVERGQWRSDKVERQMVQTANTDGLDTFTSFPQDPGAAGKAQAERFSKLLQGCRFESTPESGDKRTRAGGLAAQVNAGNVRMLNQTGAAAFLHELRTFPNGANDDQVDAASRAYNCAVAGPDHRKRFAAMAE